MADPKRESVPFWMRESVEERAFREWAFARALRANRISFGAAAAVCAALWLAIGLFLRSADTVLHALFAWMFVCFAGGLHALHLRSRTVGTVYALVTNVSACVLALYAGHLLRAQAPGLVALCGAFLGLFVPVAHRDRPWIAWVPTLLMVCGAEALCVAEWLSGEASTTALVVRSVVLWASLVVGTLVLHANDHYAREAYRQQHISEAQKETIARERARSEELLKRELSHQVAERSRELGAVLAKSDVTLDVRRLSPGERFADRYRIVAALGAGGMGAVYEVERVTDSPRGSR